MPQPQRSSDIVEKHSEHALAYSLSGIVSFAVGFLLWKYQGDGYLLGFAWAFMGGGACAIVYGIYCATQIRKVQSSNVSCPYCNFTNKLTEPPMSDISCRSCNRMIPIVDGRILRVMQVRCGYCSELNYYSEKNVVLICEQCDHEIPIAQADGNAPTKHASLYAAKDDDALYELVLVGHSGHKTEDLIGALQHMLALNRNQVKDMLLELPVTLLTGIPRRKAEMLKAQLSMHEAAAEFRSV